VITVDAGMAETEQGTPPVRARIGNTGEGGPRHPATCLSLEPRGEGLPINHLAAGEFRRALLEERRDAFAEVVGLRRHSLELRL